MISRKILKGLFIIILSVINVTITCSRADDIRPEKFLSTVSLVKKYDFRDL